MALRSNLQAVILAGGQSKPFKTEQTKLSFPLCGQELILYPVKLLEQLNIPIMVVLGYQKELIQKIIDSNISDITYAEQMEQRGTGHALLCSKASWQADHILVMNGDIPLLTEEIIQDLITKHFFNNATITFITAHNSDPELTGYGRVIRDNGSVAVLEHAEHVRSSLQHCCINGGVYLIKRSFLDAYLHRISPYAHSGEFGLPELIRMAAAQKLTVETIQVPFDYIRGVNTLKELWAVEHIKRSELISHWMAEGVRFSAAQNVHLDIDVTIGPDSFIGPGVHLLKGTHIGSHCRVEGFTYISNSVLHDHVNVLPHCLIYDSAIHAYAQIGPFAHIRKGSTIDTHATVGNFVEVSATTMGSYTKAKHLTYLGNADIGSRVNIGAGTITCNYDGFSKHATVIKEGAFIGSNSALIAPLSIGKGSLTAAGSTLTQSVPDDALAIARAPQINKEEYASARRQRLLEQTQQERISACQCTHEPQKPIMVEAS